MRECQTRGANVGVAGTDTHLFFVRNNFSYEIGLASLEERSEILSNLSRRSIIQGKYIGQTKISCLND